MRALLVSVNRFSLPYPVFPLGLDYVAEGARPHEVRILDLCATPQGAEAAAIADAIAVFAPDAVGISIRNIDSIDVARPKCFLAEMRAVVQAVRAATRAPIALGGAGYSLFPRELLDALGADYGVVGEGEQFKALLDALERGGPRIAPPGPPGVAFRGAPAPATEAWSGPIRRASPTRNPLLRWYLKHGGMLNLQTQRGCPFQCIYCTYPGLEGRRVRQMDLSEVGRTARSLEDAGAKFLFVTDSSFNASAEHALAVASAFRSAGVRIPWGAFFTPVSPPDGFYKSLAQAGCTHVEFGTDALCDAMLARIRKPFRVADVLSAHRSARDAELHTAHFLLLGGPGESRETVGETLQRAELLDEAALFFFCGMRIYPHTPLWELALAEGQIRHDQGLLEPVFYTPASIGLEAIVERVERRARGRKNWVVGGGDPHMGWLVERMHARGSTGPLWERLGS